MGLGRQSKTTVKSDFCPQGGASATGGRQCRRVIDRNSIVTMAISRNLMDDLHWIRESN